MSRGQRVTLAVLLVVAAALVGVAVWISRPADPLTAWESGPVHQVTAHPGVVLDHVFTVPTDPGGCPGYTVPAPGESLTDPSRWDGGRSEAGFLLGEESSVLLVCIGRSAEVGFPPQPEEGGIPEQLDVVAVVSAHGSGPAVTSRVGRMLLTDYFVERDGWVHAVGYLRPEGSGDVHLPVVETMLASWSWD